VEQLTYTYSSAQREAIASTYLLGAAAREVVTLAAAGELQHPSGATLRPFVTVEGTVRSLGHRERRRRLKASEAVDPDADPRDAVERRRRALLAAIDTELRRMRIEQEQGRLTKLDRLRQIARAIREVAALPGPSEPRPPAPGAKVNGVRQGGETRGGIAGRVLREQGARTRV
jgi:hypothetical protein